VLGKFGLNTSQYDYRQSTSPTPIHEAITALLSAFLTADTASEQLPLAACKVAVNRRIEASKDCDILPWSGSAEIWHDR